MEIVTLGPKGTYASKVADEIFPGEKLQFEPTISEVLDRAVTLNGANGNVIVLPLENSIEGTVRLSWDGILEKGLKIHGIYKLPVHHVLASKASDLKAIKKIASHPQAISQCRKFLKKNLPGVEIEYVGSTAEAVSKALGSEEVAAVASPFACEDAGLSILEEGIEDEKGNVTIFGVISAQDVGEDFWPGREKDEMHIMVTPKKNMPGLLFNILRPFHDEKVDLTRLESRPTRKKMGEYRFLLSFRIGAHEKVLKVLEKNYKVDILGESISLN
ncbi:hypothetical protein HOG17_05435 [Candidatus Peregrinibacteria bacterium]|nr:hypothetical protein [Candidatus Peregrinibacteria bacterium]MBT4148154.1 hypothetical protein [Candidatus Peregrinibacteria bacterium]MBT4366641.1 hypothetical protein [Candidatus Peregrinibacteria bacterium]MBT4455628.1 hypothetical protein [Candidatus Peregrinibacteria bacterium]